MIQNQTKAVCEHCGSAACLAMSKDYCQHTRRPRSANPEGANKAFVAPPADKMRRGEWIKNAPRDENGRILPKRVGGTTA